ncbi:MAG: long-chain fatty acid--CoA ligase [Enterovirga sp.]|nr:long-chain fatty acid--CoA ligase [Enterovirga sp.]
MPNLAHHLFRQGAARADKVALICGEERLTFGDLLARVRSVAGGLRQEGFGPGDKFGLMMSSRPDFIVFQQAIYAIGGVVTPLNIHYRPREVEHAATSCDLEVLVIEAAFLDRLPPDLARTCPRLRRVFVLDSEADGPAPLFGSAAALAIAPPIEAPVDMPPEALGLLLSTSATTGKAKGVMLSIGNIQSNYDPTAAWLGITERDTILCALPLYNTFGLNQCINATLSTGCTMVLLPRFETSAVLDAIERHRATFVPAVPAMLQKLLSDPSVPHRDLTSIERSLVGAASVPGPLLQRMRAVMGDGVVVMNGYGLTEATAIVTLLQVESDGDGRLLKPRSVGQTLPGIAMMIADETGRSLPPGEVGEICIKGPNVMQGYYREPGQTALALMDGWLRTGDLGTVDEDGHYYVVDRKKDVIIRGGQNVYPVDIEEVLYGDPSIGEAAVIAEPDAELGEVPVAYVALRPGFPEDAAGLIARCKAELAYFKVPRRIVFLPELPKGPTGKILRRELRPGQHAPPPPANP